MFYKLLIINVFVIFSNLHALNIQNIKSLQTDFTQSIVNNSNQTIVYKGKLFIQEPSKIVWKYETPIVKNVYVLNTLVIIDEPELEQAIFSSLQEEVNILALLKTAKKLENNIYITMIKDVEYKFFIKNEKIDKILYKDALDNRIIISLFNSTYNKNIDEKIFKFQAPKDYDIIRK